MIRKYIEFITEYQQSKYTKLREAVDFYKANCNNWDLDGTLLYRGVTNTNKDYIIIEPAKYKRTVGDSSTLYNSIIHILDEWKDYPNRLHSVIVSTSEDYAITYSKNIKSLYVVIPTNDTKIGMCNANDFWYTFDYMNKVTKLPVFKLMKKLQIIIDKENLKINKDDLSLKLNDLKNTYTDNEFYNAWSNSYSNKTLYQVLEDLFSTEKNNIQLVKKQDDIYNNGSDYELWIGNNCLLIQYEKFNDFKRLVNES